MLLPLSIAVLFVLSLIVSLFVRRQSPNRFTQWRVSAHSLAGSCFFALGINNSNYGIVVLGLVFLLVGIAGARRPAKASVHGS